MPSRKYDNNGRKKLGPEMVTLQLPGSHDFATQIIAMNILSHCTMGQVLKEMGNRKNLCFRAHFLEVLLFQIEIFEVWPLCSFTFESYLGTS